VAQVIYGLVATALAFILGITWQRLKNVFINYRARRFWAPMMSKDLQLVIGRFRGLHQFEASGMIGAGDALAMTDLHAYFGRIGFGGFRVSYNEQLGYGDPSGETLRTNLILLGGPDANSLTYDVVKRLNLGVAFKEIDSRQPDELFEPRVFEFPESDNDSQSRFSFTRIARSLRNLTNGAEVQLWRTPVFVDLLDGRKVYQPTKDGDHILEDCGLIVRAPNPFDQTKNVVIMCGSYGYGTWAAVQLVQTKAFVKQIPRSGRTLECIFRVDVVRDTPQRLQISLLRPISDRPLRLRSRSSSPPREPDQIPN
jgi:hypothetical protein